MSDHPPLQQANSAASFTTAELTQVAALGDRTRRMLTFVALLEQKLAGTLPIHRPIIVGGGAVDVYTTGSYASQDIDLIVVDPRLAEAILARSGFVKHGRHWSHVGLDVLVEFPGTTLTYAPQAYERISRIDLGHNLFATVIGIEDIFIGRVYSGVSEHRENDLKWAREMALLHHQRMDWNVIEQLALQNGKPTHRAVNKIHAMITGQQP